MSERDDVMLCSGWCCCWLQTAYHTRMWRIHTPEYRTYAKFTHDISTRIHEHEERPSMCASYEMLAGWLVAGWLVRSILIAFSAHARAHLCRLSRASMPPHIWRIGARARVCCVLLYTIAHDAHCRKAAAKPAGSSAVVLVLLLLPQLLVRLQKRARAAARAAGNFISHIFQCSASQPPKTSQPASQSQTRVDDSNRARERAL